MASAAVEPNQQSDSTFASKSTRTLDNPSNNNTPAKCNHFSIRGYVSEVRKRDPVLCDPFGVLNDGYELPPMEVPRFRWWQCAGCVPEAANQEVQTPADVVETMKIVCEKGTNVGASTSTESNENNVLSLAATPSADRKGKGKAHVEEEPATSAGYQNGFLKASPIQGIVQLTLGGPVNHPSSVDEVVRSRCNENNISEPHQLAEAFVHAEGGRSDELQGEELPTSLDAANAVTQENSRGTDTVDVVDGLKSEGKDNAVSLPDLNESNSESSDDDENCAITTVSEKNVSDEDDDYLGADRRKIPKVRLLSELLELPENKNEGKFKKKNSSLVSSCGPSTSRSTFSDTQGDLSINDNGKRKRVDEESKSVERKGFLVNGARKPRTSYVMVDSESESEDRPAEVVPEALGKRRSKPTLERSPLVDSRNKRIKIADTFAPLGRGRDPFPPLYRKRMVPKLSHEKGKSSEKRPSIDAYPEKSVDEPQEGDVSVQLNERNSVLTMNKGKMAQPENEQASLVPSKNSLQAERDLEGKDDEAARKATENARAESVENQILLFPNGYLSMGGAAKVQIPPAKDGFKLLSFAAEANPSSSRSPVSATFPGSQFFFNGESSAAQGSNSKGKQVWVPPAGVGIGPSSQHTAGQASSSVVSQKDLTIEVQRRIQDIDINSIPADDKAPEQGPGERDDIPMDIVELMAKNQYERNLVEPKDDHNLLNLSSFGNSVRTNGNVSADRPPLGQIQFLSMTPAQIAARNSIINRSSEENLRYSSSNLSQNHSSVRGGLVRDNRMPPPLPFSLSSGQVQEQISPYYNRNSQAAAGQRFPQSFIEAVDSYNRYKSSSPQPNRDPPPFVWPSVAARRSPGPAPTPGSSRMPVGITNPDMHRKGKPPQQPSSSRVISFTPVTLGKQNNANVSKNVTKSSGSSGNIYSNEAIPAMHLLSLMQNNAGSSGASSSSGPSHQKAQQKQQDPHKAGPSSLGQNLLGRSPLQNNYPHHPCYPAVPVVQPFPSSLQNRSNGGFISPIPLTSSGQRNIGTSQFVPLGPQRRHMAPDSFHRDGKGVLGMSSFSLSNPSQQANNDASPSYMCGVATTPDERTSCPPPEKDICVLSRNPSEYNDLRDLCKYMIMPEDLRRKGKGIMRVKITPKRKPYYRKNKGITIGTDKDKQRKS